MLRFFCPTIWRVRIVSLKIIDSNYNILRTFFNQLTTGKNEIVAKASSFFETILFLFFDAMNQFIFETIDI